MLLDFIKEVRLFEGLFMPTTIIQVKLIMDYLLLLKQLIKTKGFRQVVIFNLSHQHQVAANWAIIQLVMEYARLADILLLFVRYFGPLLTLV